ncbi:MAG: hypothetical protein FJZ64_03300 [Chlamydiae bacterium]|nr:hypothetical protein [Chlamydiota bacterium]
MQTSVWVLKTILSQYPEDKRKSLETFLSSEEKEALDALPSAELKWEDEPPILDRIHWSWFLPILKAHAQKEQKLFVSSLPKAFQEPIRHELKMREIESSLSEVGKRFLLKTLMTSLVGEEIRLLPIFFLPLSSLMPLLKLDKNEMIRFVDRLSLFDLADAMQRIVETKILKKIYSFLSEEEQGFLKMAMAQKQKTTLAPLKLESWDGSQSKLRLLLHKRGLSRLGIALSTQHPDFTWYVCHSLDVGRGSSLEKSSKIEATPSVRKMALKQAEEILRRGFA